MNRKLHQDEQRSSNFKSTSWFVGGNEIVCNYHVMLQVEVPRKPSGFMDEIPLCLYLCLQCKEASRIV